MKTLLIWVCTMAALTAQCQCDLKESVLSQDSNLPTSRLLRRHNSQHSSRQAHHHPGLLNRSTALNSEAIYWVNLDAAEHRRVGMIRRIRFYGYRSIRVPAYDKEAISLQHLAVIPECLVKQHVPCRGAACPMGLILPRKCHNLTRNCNPRCRLSYGSDQPSAEAWSRTSGYCSCHPAL